MPQVESPIRKHARRVAWRRSPQRLRHAEARYTVALSADLAKQVEQYASTIDSSMSKAIASLVRQGLDSRENRKREFFKKLRANLTEDDPKQQDRLADEFRNLVLGR